MIPLYDVVPTRTTPFVTLSLIAALTMLFMAGPQPLPVAAMHAGSTVAGLWLFGRAVEDRTGHLRFLLLYLFAAAASVVLLLATARVSFLAAFVAIIGSAGGVAGVIGAYFALFPRSYVLTLIPVPFALRIIEVPALAIVATWMVLQLFAAGQFVWTCAPGAVLGGAAVLVFRRPDRLRVEWWDAAAVRHLHLQS